MIFRPAGHLHYFRRSSHAETTRRWHVKPRPERFLSQPKAADIVRKVRQRTNTDIVTLARLPRESILGNTRAATAEDKICVIEAALTD